MAKMGTSGADLVAHWSWAVKKGLMNRNSAFALRSACQAVLGVEAGWESTDVATLDLDQLIERFENLRGREYSPGSLAD